MNAENQGPNEQQVPAQPEPPADDFGMGLDDILDIANVPLPPEVETDTVEDEIKTPTAFKFAFIGAGQGGGRIAHQFWQYGYRRVCAVNTADSDLKPLELPEDHKLKLVRSDGGEGSGGDVNVAREAARSNSEEVFMLMRRTFGPEFDRVFVTVTAGGGTGAGSCEEIVNVANKLLEKLELQDEQGYSRVGVIIALPKEADGRDAHRSAYHTVKSLMRLVPKVISPLIIIDNQRIDRLYPGRPTGQFYATANHAACSIFHLLNLVSARESEYTSFDQSDYESILRSGLLAYGAMPVKDWTDPDSISRAVRDNLKRNVLVSGLDFSTGTVAGCVIVGEKSVLDNDLPQKHLDDGFSMLGRMIAPNSPVKHGVYGSQSPGLTAYTIIGGINEPDKRLTELAKLGGVRDYDGA